MKTHIKFLVTMIAIGMLALYGCAPSPIPTATSDIPTDITTQTPISTPLPQGNIIIVASISDSGPGTLRRALQDAQPYDTITFDPDIFPPDAPVTIFVSTALPHIRVNNLTLDASNAGVILDGSRVSGDWEACLQIVGTNAVVIQGLQISNFSGPGIAISGDAKNNLIGGDRSLGAGPYGQGNLFIHNAHGIDLSTGGTTLNTIKGNLIGMDATGTMAFGNQTGIWITGAAHDNTIGPDNIIAHNSGPGVVIEYSDTLHNTITQNSIYEHGYQNILLKFGSNAHLAAPIIFEYDLAAGTIKGATCPNCTIEIFSDNGRGGAIYEAQTTADDEGVFIFNKGDSFTGPNLTATATDLDGNTSEFSLPTFGKVGSLFLQRNDHLPRTQFLSLESRELADNRIAKGFDNFGSPEIFDLGLYSLGIKRARVAIAGTEPERVDWDRSEFSIDPSHDAVFTRMADNGLTITYNLIFWDKDTYPGGEGAPCARFKTEAEIEHYLEFVRFTVHHFKDRVQYYEIWNEPDIANYCPKWIQAADYINLVKRTVPVIREEYPEAKIVVGSVSGTRYPNAYNYLMTLLESDIMPLVDVIAWHPMYGDSPTVDKGYYYGYPAMVQRIKDTATAHGFVGEYQADELTWSTPYSGPDLPWVYSPIVAAKYTGRGILMHLGMDVGVELGTYYDIVPKLSTIMAGAEPVNLPIQIQSTATNIASYTFSLSDGGYLVALWTDGIAVENDPGIEASLTIPGFSASEAIGIDSLYGLEQELNTVTENGNLVIRNLLVKDYPIILRFVGPHFAEPRFVEPTKPPVEPVTIKLRRDAEERLPAGTPIQLTIGWLTGTQAQVGDFLTAINVTGTLDGQPLPDLNSYFGSIEPYSGGGYISQWLYPLGVLSPGTHTVEIRGTLTQPVTDGSDVNKDGQLDEYSGEIWRFTIQIEVY